MVTMEERTAAQIIDLPLVVNQENCAGGTFIVTGANTGIGREIAKNLASVGAAKVIMSVRNVEAGNKAKSSIEAEVSSAGGVLEVWPLDLSSYASVKAFAKRAESELERIDALIENAGVAISDRVMAEGHLINTTVNVLSTVLLALLLMPKLRADAAKFGIQPTVTIVSSGTALFADESWAVVKDDPVRKMDGEDVATWTTYPLSKLLEVFAVRQIARLAPLDRTNVVVNVVCPGLCVTELDRHLPKASDTKQQIGAAREAFGRTADGGSRAVLFGPVAGPESHGAYLDSCKIHNDYLPEYIVGEEGLKSEKKVWDDIVAELNKVEPGCAERAFS